MTNQRSQITYLLFLACTSIFLIFEQLLFILDFLTAQGIGFGVVSGVLFVVCAFSYISLQGSIRERMVLFSFIASAINLLAMLYYVGTFPISTYEQLAFDLFMYVLMIMTTSLPFFLGIYLVRGKNKMTARLGYVLILIGVALIVLCFASGLVVGSYKIDDEMYIGMISMANLIAHGTNPYVHSLATYIYSTSSIGITIATNNHISSKLNYPALYMFSSAPFILLAAPTIYNLGHIISGAQYAVFLAFLIVVIGFSIERDNINRELIGLILLIGFTLVFQSSITTILMLALLILAYKETGKKYSWLLLGLCVSIQELLWIPVLLIIVYTFRNYGIKKGFYDVIGVASVFLLLNAYFILDSPVMFFGDIFSVTRGSLLLFSASPFGAFALLSYHTLLSLSALAFYLTVLLVAVTCLYFNNKRLIGLLSMIPFMFAFRSLPSYYPFFALFIFVGLMIKPTEERRTRPNSRYGILLAVLACLLIAGLVVAAFSSHMDYVRGLDLSVSNQSALRVASSNSVEYLGTLHYNGNGTAYLMFFGYNTMYGAIELGIRNQSLINGSVRCASGNVTCMVNVNRVTLDPSNHTLKIAAKIPYFFVDGSNVIRIAIYTGNYFYLGNAVQYK